MENKKMKGDKKLIKVFIRNNLPDNQNVAVVVIDSYAATEKLEDGIKNYGGMCNTFKFDVYG